MSAWMLPAAIGGSALLGFLGQKDANKTAQQIANTPNVRKAQSSYVPHQMANPLFGYAGGIGQQMGQTPTPYFPGMGYVGPSGPTQQGVSLGMGAIPTMQAGLGLAGRNYSFLSGAADVANNPYVQGQLGANRSAVQEMLNSNLARGAGAASRAGMLGSSADALMRGEAIGDAAEALSRTNASTMLGAYGQGLGAQQSALGQTGAMLGNLMAPANAALGIGQGVEGYQQAALQDAMNRFNYQYQEPWQRMGNIQSALGILQPLGTAYNNSAGTGNTNALAGVSNPLLAGLGGGLGGLQLAGALGLLNQPNVSAGQVGNMYSNAMVQNPQNFGTFGAYF